MKWLIGADLVPTKNTNDLFVKQDFKTLFADSLEIIKGYDRFIVNLECALTNSDNAIKKFGPNIKADPRCADAIKAIGVTDVMLANNHVFDFGVAGLTDTLANLERVGIPYTGVGENDEDSRKIYYIEQEGKRVAIVNVCEHEYTYALPDRMGANPFDPFITMQDVRKAKKNADNVIVIYHGGKEYCRYPSPRLRNLCHELVYCGADVVLAQHSHCIGCYENVEGGHIVYGQGNYHFCDNSEDDFWCTSLLVTLDIQDKVEIGFIPLISKKDGIELAKNGKAEEIMKGFFDRNEELKTGKWKEGWHAFCEGVKEKYFAALQNLHEVDTPERKNHLFAHYLDCEAHTDVWRELHPTWNQTNEK